MHTRNARRRALAVLLPAAALAGGPSAAADTPVPTVSKPIPVTDSSHPFGGAEFQLRPQNLNREGYVETEHLVSGKANVYTWTSPGAANVRTADAPYTTRILVRRPKQAKDFSGNVVVEMLNPSNLFDLNIGWGLAHKEIIRHGDAWVGITAKPIAVDALKSFPSDEALLALNQIGVHLVVTPTPVAPASEDAPWPLVERARFADGVIYEFRWTPEIDARLSRELAVTPDPPGPIPFAPGETARYSVRWAGAAVNMSAGDITIAVQPPAYTFLVRAETAPWVSRFFEARDVFLTRTDDQLLPQLHERDQREGSRHVTRAYAYQHDEGVVRIGRTPEHAMSEEGVSLPLAPGSRDAIATVFYARTLPLEPGRRFLIPVNEAGRQVVVELLVARRERISVNGREMDALRLEPQMRRGAAPRRSGTATLWVSDDARKLPVALDLAAGFGQIRLELVSYTP